MTMQTLLKKDAPAVLHEKTQRIDLLKDLFESLDLTPTQIADARRSYEAVGGWIAESDDSLLRAALISAQGSIALGTATRPVRGNEFDVDALSLSIHLPPTTVPQALKGALGQRLRDNGTYRDMLEEKPRCWRLNYAGQFHLDITPAIRNPHCDNGGMLVPDKNLKGWKPTNPKGYKERFDQYAAIVPNFPLLRAFTEARADSTVAPFPEENGRKRLLPLIVKMVKRQRDIYYLDREDAELAPISVIVTTLLAWSYAERAHNRTYDSELDFVIDVVRHMPKFIRQDFRDGKMYYSIPNETTAGENFAEKWNADPRLPKAFFNWHNALMSILGDFDQAQGIDAVGKSLSVAFGDSAVKTTFGHWAASVSNARANQTLNVAAGVGLNTNAGSGVQVRSNSFFGSSR
jgi:hypothetical protein